jgi:spermidine synthase
MADPRIAADLGAVFMGTPEDLLSYVVMGTEGARAYGAGGVVNTDDNLFLEFSAPESIGVGWLMGANVAELERFREPLLGHLAPAPDEAGRAAQAARWVRADEAARVYGRAHALFLRGKTDTGEFEAALATLEARSPRFGPYRFLRRELEDIRAASPQLAAQAAFPVTGASGAAATVQLAAVKMRIGESRAVVMFVDNARREVFGERYIDAGPDELDALVDRFAVATVESARADYARLADEARRRGDRAPAEAVALDRLRRHVRRAVGAP